MKRNYELITDVIKLKDYLEFILQNFLREKLWSRTWTLFEWNGNSVKLEISRIDVKRKKLEMNVIVEVNELTDRFGINSVNDYNTIDIPYEEAHRNLELFANQIINKALFGMWWIEKRAIRTKEAYIEAEEIKSDLENKYSEIASDFMDEVGVENETVKRAYVNAYVDEMMNEHPDFLEKVVDEYEYTILAKLYVMFCLFTDAKESTKEKYIENAKLNGFEIGRIRKEVQELRDALETEEFEADASLKLQPIY